MWILQTNQSFIIYTVGQLYTPVQRESPQLNLSYVCNAAAAMVAAKALVEPGRRILSWNVDTSGGPEMAH